MEVTRAGAEVDAFPRVERGTRYPWGEWLDGDVRERTAGVDFTCTPAALRTLARIQ